ncbi:hypothetical protein MA411_005374, partial [Klebsiella pneumoniae]
AYCLKIQPATGSFARNLIYSTKPILTYLKLSIALPPDDFSVSTKAREKIFLYLTVHTVHLLFFLFNIIMIDGKQLVKSEQSTLHLSASLACFRRSSPQYDGDEGG